MTEKFWEMDDELNGEPLVVIGNGPGLASVPDEFLAKHHLMGCNSIYTHEYLWENPVDYYVIEGVGHLKKPQERLARVPYLLKVAENGGKNLINRRMFHHFQHIPSCYAVDYQDYRGQPFRNFQFDPFLYYGTGHCVTFAMLQFAYYLTEGPVLMIGMDHRFRGENWHYYPDENAPEFHTMPSKEYKTFRQKVDPMFEQAAKVFRVTDRQLLNLTPNSAAVMFETGDINDW